MAKATRKIYISGSNKKYVSRNISLVNLYNEIRRYDPLTSEETESLIKTYHDGTEKEKKCAFDKLCKHNIKLVVSVAKKYASNENEVNDLIQEGNIGLIEAINRFNPELGVPFYAYAVYWIRREINMYRTNVNPTVIQTNRSKTSITISKVTNELTQKLERIPTKHEILEEFNKTYPDKKISNSDDFVDVEYVYISEIESSYNVNTASMKDEFDYNSKTVSNNEYLNEIDKTYNKDLVNQLLSCLTDKERDIITMAYGIGGQCSVGTSVIAGEYSMTVAGVNNICARAISKMKKYKEKLALASV